MAPDPPRDERGGVLPGLFTGALIGAALAMILAPPGGEQMRELLRSKAREVENRSRVAADDPNPTSPH